VDTDESFSVSFTLEKIDLEIDNVVDDNCKK